jgi:hypothetical protein
MMMRKTLFLEADFTYVKISAYFACSVRILIALLVAVSAKWWRLLLIRERLLFNSIPTTIC